MVDLTPKQSLRVSQHQKYFHTAIIYFCRKMLVYIPVLHFIGEKIAAASTGRMLGNPAKYFISLSINATRARCSTVHMHGDLP
mmetsp:Transcript_31052/g.48865  ORF Transcript_31052/g.48865 Transcript_31052/m.48865 type:complete len:83 (+) Transcript_31052:942-1190(+)